MALELFSTEYNILKEVVNKQKFGGPLKSVMESVKTIFGDGGFDETCLPALELMRGLLRLKESERILETAGCESTKTTAPDETALKKAAAVKFLRHLYLVRKRGSQKVWVFDSPKAYGHYPTEELNVVKADLSSIKRKLADRDEQFGETRRAPLGEATMTGLAWCHKASLVLVESGAKPDSEAMKIVKRWFAESNTTNEELNALIGKLSAGFKKVAATLNSNQLIFTDMASVRGATSGKERDLLNAYAFVFSGRYEVIPVVYIENAFFAKNSTPIPDKTLWAITVVHEVTHLDVSTKDHRYDYKGLKPGKKLSASQAGENADSWASAILGDDE